MRLWTTGAGEFWARAIPSLAALFFAGALFHATINPPRIYWSDYLMAAPVILCGVVSTRAGKDVDVWTRLSFGILQGLVLIAIYSNHWSVMATPYQLMIDWATRAGAYAVVFAGVTQVLSARSAGRRRDPMQCGACGYSLRGLTVPRCPECNTSFDPALLHRDGPE